VQVAAVIAAGTAAEAEQQARVALRRGADLVELRLDALRRATAHDLRSLASALGPRAIATLRSPSQGGFHPMDGGVRHTLLREACRLPFRYVDVELTTDAAHLEEYAKAAKSRAKDLLVSHHFDRPAETDEVSEILDACLSAGTVGKVAVPTLSVEAAVDLVDLAREHPSRRFVLLGMGEPGMLTRALAADTGQEFQYAVGNRPTTPGQLPLATAVRLRSKDAFVLGLLGHPLGHSVSPQIHEAALEVLGLPGAYLPFEVPRDSLEPFLDAAGRLRARGFNVTTPYKETVAELMDELDGDAESLEAVNTIVLREGWTKGHNTDVLGFRMSLRSLGLRVGDRKALVVGAGGAARAVVHVLLREGARVQITNRNPERAEALADAFDDVLSVLSPEDVPRKGPWDLLVNATPAGTRGMEADMPVPESSLDGTRFVYDLVYNPTETPLLQAARRRGIRGTNGLEMLLQQAAASFELWTGKAAPFDAMKAAAREALR
jgi:shikimate dehydrogenase/3-dehydroquinate dehydratase type I